MEQRHSGLGVTPSSAVVYGLLITLVLAVLSMEVLADASFGAWLGIAVTVVGWVVARASERARRWERDDDENN